MFITGINKTDDQRGERKPDQVHSEYLNLFWGNKLALSSA